jgi:hypothetical protein
MIWSSSVKQSQRQPGPTGPTVSKYWIRLCTMFGCFQRAAIVCSQCSSATWPTVATLRAASMPASAVDLRSCFSPAASGSRASLARNSLAH